MAARENVTAVITGVGVVSPIGIGVDEFWASLMEGRSGVRPVPELEQSAVPVRFGGSVVDFEPKQYVKPRKSLKVMSREIQMAFAAAGLALENAQTQPLAVTPDRFGIVFGSDMLYCDLHELEEVYRSCLVDRSFDFARWGESAMSDMNPLWLLKYLPNMPACHLAIAHDARGHNNSISLGDASSLVALTEAARVIQRGHADVMISGGTGSRLSLTPMLYRGDRNLSHRREQPARACRPFDLERDGMVNGEGAGAFILESRAHAEARGARVLAQVSGCGVATEARTNGSPESGVALRQSLVQALEEAGAGLSEIDHVNARGNSAVDEDVSEAGALRDVLGDAPVTALKSYFGNLGAGTGAVELAATLLSFVHEVVPPSLNYETPDPRCDLNIIRDQGKPVTQHSAVAVNQAGTGQAVAVVLKREL